MTMIEEALTRTTDTKACVVGPNTTPQAAAMFQQLFPERRAIVVADDNTWRVAGATVQAALDAAGIPSAPAFVFHDPELYAHWDYVLQLKPALESVDAVAVAVGSGVINDLTKFVSDQLGRPYMVVGTAASMDGYTAYGASITKDGIKQTMNCAAPRGCIVDTQVAAEAPKEMVASGYADLIAKVPAGADWMLADALGIEGVDDFAWRLVQGPLRDSLAKPAACAAGDEVETRKLCEGLVMSGFAMQAIHSSRPASGTEHQFSHYWDMEGLCHQGKHVSHGFKVGIGTLASTAALEFLLEQDLSNLDVEACVAAWWPDYETLAATFPSVFPNRPAHVTRALAEMKVKFPSKEALRDELNRAKAAWPTLAPKIREQIMSFDEVHAALKAVGAPYEPEQIGIDRARFRETFRGVPYMRTRWFSLDLLCRIGKFEALLERLFGPNGIWAI